MIKVSFDAGGAARPDRIGEELRFAARPLLRGLAAAALARAEGRRSRYRFDEEEAFDSGTRIDVQVDAEELVEAIRAAAVDGLQRFLDGLDEGLRAMAEKAEEPAPKPRRAAKPKSKAKAKAKAGRKRRASGSSAASD